MSDAEGRGSVSEDESSMRPAARSKRLPGKCDSPDTQDSSEAVSHGGSKAGRGALPCQDDKKGRGVGRAKCVWAAMLGGDCYGCLAWQRQDPLRSSCQAKQGRLGGHLWQSRMAAAGWQTCTASTASASLVQADFGHVVLGSCRREAIPMVAGSLAGNSAEEHIPSGTPSLARLRGQHLRQEQGPWLGGTKPRCQQTRGQLPRAV